MIHPRQIKAARALLNWTGDDLAAATGLSVTTIRNLEAGQRPRVATNAILRDILERRGIEFLDLDGVRYRNDIVKVYRDQEGTDAFLDDLMQHAKEQGSEILASFKSIDVLVRLFGVKNGKCGRFEQINQHADIKCLVPDVFDPLLSTQSFQIRTILRQHIGSASYVVFGNKHTMISAPDDGKVVYLIFNSAGEAHDNRKHFYTLWEMAPPIFQQYKNRDQRVAV